MRKYFRVHAILLLTLILSISAVYYEGEKQLEADNKFQKNNKINNISDCIDIVELYAGVQEQTIDRQEEYQSLRSQIALTSTKIEMADIERRETNLRMQMQMNREKLIEETCRQYVGKIKYVYGMKSTYDNWSLDQGLDCSGFVQYVYNQCGLETLQNLESTLSIHLECYKIEHDELRIGYLGMIEDDGSYYEDKNGNVNYTGDFNNDGKLDTDIKTHSNHVGIYLGVNSNGNDIWCHCNAKDGTVIIGEYARFEHFYKVDIKEYNE